MTRGRRLLQIECQRVDTGTACRVQGRCIAIDCQYSVSKPGHEPRMTATTTGQVKYSASGYQSGKPSNPCRWLILGDVRVHQYDQMPSDSVVRQAHFLAHVAHGLLRILARLIATIRHDRTHE